MFVLFSVTLPTLELLRARTVMERGFMSQLTATERKKQILQFIVCKSYFRLFLHYHDYIIDGRWVVTENVDSNDENAVVRNRGDGFDDEECPEKETFGWELRSKKAPGKIIYLIFK
jgi:hypothetical protein